MVRGEEKAVHGCYESDWRALIVAQLKPKRHLARARTGAEERVYCWIPLTGVEHDVQNGHRLIYEDSLAGIDTGGGTTTETKDGAEARRGIPHGVGAAVRAQHTISYLKKNQKSYI